MPSNSSSTVQISKLLHFSNWNQSKNDLNWIILRLMMQDWFIFCWLTNCFNPRSLKYKSYLQSSQKQGLLLTWLKQSVTCDVLNNPLIMQVAADGQEQSVFWFLLSLSAPHKHKLIRGRRQPCCCAPTSIVLDSWRQQHDFLSHLTISCYTTILLPLD